MIRIALLGLAVAIASTSEASAQNKMYYGAGSISCAEWLRYRSTGNKPNSYQAQAWMDGFLSGYNVADDGADFLAPLKPVAIYAGSTIIAAQNL